MSKSRFTRALALVTGKMKWSSNQKSVGFSTPERKDRYLNPLVTPPPRSPATPDDFKHPERLGHWKSLGYDYINPTADRYYANEACFFLCFSMIFWVWLWSYGPDYNLSEWARREAFLRTHKREALGLPLIDKNMIDPERIILPTEEEIGSYTIRG